MTLTLRHIVSREEKSRAVGDRRRRVIRVTASYCGEDGHEYRKAFESYAEPTIPTSGTHRALNALQSQWNA